MSRPDRARLIDPGYFLFDLGKLIAFPPGLVWFRPRFIYESKRAKKRLRGGAILMINHTGFTDPIMAQFAVWYRRQHFVATTELFSSPFRRWLFGVFHCIEIDRSNFNLGTFRTITAALEGVKVVTIYPEGHINDEKGVAAFKDGIVMMALRSGRPVVPLYIRKQEKWYERATFVIGEPINLKERYGGLPSMDTVREISEALRKKEIELKELIGEDIR